MISCINKQIMIPFMGDQVIYNRGLLAAAITSRIFRYKISGEFPPGVVSPVEGLSFVSLKIEGPVS